jgi:hypothetical protein
MSIVALIGTVCTMVIGLWKLFGRKAVERRARVDAADTLFQKGVADDNKSEIVAGLNDLHNS